MLDSTIELISLAASNSLAVFCFCNLLIGILLVGSSKSSSQFNEAEPNPFPSIDDESNTGVTRIENASCSHENQKVGETDAKSVCITMADADEGRRNDEEEDDVDDLTRRVEEFIEKINRGWRDEKLKTYSLGQ
ncbi:Uncharacterized protein Adt_12155 [Abeliophyllum distichum]|uniref:Uncharacterized protein n=1 Tax=Abeliophyllum distichum TaxID=126358 RepID=A0ABD1UQ00_9LAMI